jgi:hypothetical protein
MEGHESIDAVLDVLEFGKFQHMLLVVTGLTLLADAFELMLLPFLQVPL